MGIYLGIYSGFSCFQNKVEFEDLPIKFTNGAVEIIKFESQTLKACAPVLFPALGAAWRKNRFQIKAEVGVPVLKTFERDNMAFRDTFNAKVGIGYRVACPLTVSLLAGVQTTKYKKLYVKDSISTVNFELKGKDESFYSTQFTLGGEIQIKVCKGIYVNTAYQYGFGREKSDEYKFMASADVPAGGGAIIDKGTYLKNPMTKIHIEKKIKNKLSMHRVTVGVVYEF